MSHTSKAPHFDWIFRKNPVAGKTSGMEPMEDTSSTFNDERKVCDQVLADAVAGMARVGTCIWVLHLFNPHHWTTQWQNYLRMTWWINQMLSTCLWKIHYCTLVLLPRYNRIRLPTGRTDDLNPWSFHCSSLHRLVHPIRRFFSRQKINLSLFNSSVASDNDLPWMISRVMNEAEPNAFLAMHV